MFMDIGGGIRLRVYDSRKENILQEKKKLSLYIWVNITSTFGPNPKPLYRKKSESNRECWQGCYGGLVSYATKGNGRG